MYNCNESGLSPYGPTKLAIHSILRPEDDLISNCGPNVKKTVSFDDVVHFLDKENIVTYVDSDCSNVNWQGIRQQSFKIGNISAM